VKKLKIRCPYAHLKDDFFVCINVIARDGLRPLSSEEFYFLVKDCTECDENTEIEIKEDGTVTGCPAIEKYKANSEKLGYDTFIKEKKEFLKNLLAKEFNFLLLKEQIIGLEDNPNLKNLFQFIQKYKEQKSKEQS